MLSLVTKCKPFHTSNINLSLEFLSLYNSKVNLWVYELLLLIHLLQLFRREGTSTHLWRSWSPDNWRGSLSSGPSCVQSPVLWKSILPGFLFSSVLYTGPEKLGWTPHTPEYTMIKLDLIIGIRNKCYDIEFLLSYFLEVPLWRKKESTI